MSAEDDLLNDFFAEINSLPTPTTECSARKPDNTIITSTTFVQCSDPTISSQVQKPKPKSNQDLNDRYISPVFAEVDPDEKRKERVDKFFDNEVANIKKAKPHYRRANGETWVDETLSEWNENDFRLFVGNLGREVTTEILANQFRQRYPSFSKARVVENKIGRGSLGYGFVAFSDPIEGIKVMKEMDGKLCGSRPMKIMKSDWKKKDESIVKKKERKVKKETRSIASSRTSQ